MEKSYSYPQKNQEPSAPCKPDMPEGGNSRNEFPYTPCSPIPLAIAYVPMQTWEGLYEYDVALMRGTLFSALDKPFIGEEAVPK